MGTEGSGTSELARNILDGILGHSNASNVGSQSSRDHKRQRNSRNQKGIEFNRVLHEYLATVYSGLNTNINYNILQSIQSLPTISAASNSSTSAASNTSTSAASNSSPSAVETHDWTGFYVSPYMDSTTFRKKLANEFVSRRHGVLGPAHGGKRIIFLDDIQTLEQRRDIEDNIVNKDKEDICSPLELLRQCVETRGWHSWRSGEHARLEDIQFMAVFQNDETTFRSMKSFLLRDSSSFRRRARLERALRHFALLRTSDWNEGADSASSGDSTHLFYMDAMRSLCSRVPGIEYLSRSGLVQELLSKCERIYRRFGFGMSHWSNDLSEGGSSNSNSSPAPFFASGLISSASRSGSQLDHRNSQVFRFCDAVRLLSSVLYFADQSAVNLKQVQLYWNHAAEIHICARSWSLKSHEKLLEEILFSQISDPEDPYTSLNQNQQNDRDDLKYHHTHSTEYSKNLGHPSEKNGVIINKIDFMFRRPLEVNLKEQHKSLGDGRDSKSESSTYEKMKNRSHLTSPLDPNAFIHVPQVIEYALLVKNIQQPDLLQIDGGRSKNTDGALTSGATNHEVNNDDNPSSVLSYVRRFTSDEQFAQRALRDVSENEGNISTLIPLPFMITDMFVRKVQEVTLLIQYPGSLILLESMHGLSEIESIAFASSDSLGFVFRPFGREILADTHPNSKLDQWREWLKQNVRSAITNLSPTVIFLWSDQLQTMDGRQIMDDIIEYCKLGSISQLFPTFHEKLHLLRDVSKIIRDDDIVRAIHAIIGGMASKPISSDQDHTNLTNNISENSKEASSMRQKSSMETKSNPEEPSGKNIAISLSDTDRDQQEQGIADSSHRQQQQRQQQQQEGFYQYESQVASKAIENNIVNPQQLHRMNAIFDDLFARSLRFIVASRGTCLSSLDAADSDEDLIQDEGPKDFISNGNSQDQSQQHSRQDGIHNQSRSEWSQSNEDQNQSHINHENFRSHEEDILHDEIHEAPYENEYDFASSEQLEMIRSNGYVVSFHGYWPGMIEKISMQYLNGNSNDLDLSFDKKKVISKVLSSCVHRLFQSLRGTYRGPGEANKKKSNLDSVKKKSSAGESPRRGSRRPSSLRNPSTSSLIGIRSDHTADSPSKNEKVSIADHDKKSSENVNDQSKAQSSNPPTPNEANCFADDQFLDVLVQFRQIYSRCRTKLQKESAICNQRIGKLDAILLEVRNQMVILEKKQVELDSLSIRTAAFFLSVENEQRNVDRARQELHRGEEEYRKIADEERGLRQSCAMDMAKVQPVLDKALRQVEMLNRSDMYEVKSMANPPKGVQLVMEAMCLLYGIESRAGETKWETARRCISDPHFVNNIMNFDLGSVTHATIVALAPFIQHPEFDPTRVQKISRAILSLCHWVLAVEKFWHAQETIRPKRALIKESELRMVQFMAQLQVNRQQLKDLQMKLTELKQEFDNLMGSKERLMHEIQRLRERQEKAEELAKHLEIEQISLQKEQRRLENHKKNMIGDALLAALCISFYPLMKLPQSRKRMLNIWMKMCSSNGLLCDGQFSLLQYMTRLDVQLEEALQPSIQLYLDAVLLENAVCAVHNSRWVISLDPHHRVVDLIRNIEKRAPMEILEANDSLVLEKTLRALHQDKHVIIRVASEEQFLSDMSHPIRRLMFCRDRLRHYLFSGRPKHVCIQNRTISIHEKMRLYVVVESSKYEWPRYRQNMNHGILCMSTSGTNEVGKYDGSVISFSMLRSHVRNRLIEKLAEHVFVELPAIKSSHYADSRKKKRTQIEIVQRFYQLLMYSTLEDINGGNGYGVIKASALEVAAIRDKRAEIIERHLRLLYSHKPLHLPAAFASEAIFLLIKTQSYIHPAYAFDLNRCVSDILHRFYILCNKQATNTSSNNKGSDSKTRNAFQAGHYSSPSQSQFSQHRTHQTKLDQHATQPLQNQTQMQQVITKSSQGQTETVKNTQHLVNVVHSTNLPSIGLLMECVFSYLKDISNEAMQSRDALSFQWTLQLTMAQYLESIKEPHQSLSCIEQAIRMMMTTSASTAASRANYDMKNRNEQKNDIVNNNNNEQRNENVNSNNEHNRDNAIRKDEHIDLKKARISIEEDEGDNEMTDLLRWIISHTSEDEKFYVKAPPHTIINVRNKKEVMDVSSWRYLIHSRNKLQLLQALLSFQSDAISPKKAKSNIPASSSGNSNSFRQQSSVEVQTYLQDPAKSPGSSLESKAPSSQTQMQLRLKQSLEEWENCSNEVRQEIELLSEMVPSTLPLLMDLVKSQLKGQRILLTAGPLWDDLLQTSNPVAVQLPAPWQSLLKAFRRLLLIRALRVDSFENSMTQLLESNTFCEEINDSSESGTIESDSPIDDISSIGNSKASMKTFARTCVVQEPPINSRNRWIVEEIEPEDNSTPVLFLTHPENDDPLTFIRRRAEKLGIQSSHIISISMGEGCMNKGTTSSSLSASSAMRKSSTALSMSSSSGSTDEYHRSEIREDTASKNQDEELMLLVDESVRKGTWIYLQNIELCSREFLVKLDERIQSWTCDSVSAFSSGASSIAATSISTISSSSFSSMSTMSPSTDITSYSLNKNNTDGPIRNSSSKSASANNKTPTPAPVFKTLHPNFRLWISINMESLSGSEGSRIPDGILRRSRKIHPGNCSGIEWHMLQNLQDIESSNVSMLTTPRSVSQYRRLQWALCSIYAEIMSRLENGGYAFSEPFHLNRAEFRQIGYKLRQLCSRLLKNERRRLSSAASQSGASTNIIAIASSESVPLSSSSSSSSESSASSSGSGSADVTHIRKDSKRKEGQAHESERTVAGNQPHQSAIVNPKQEHSGYVGIKEISSKYHDGQSGQDEGDPNYTQSSIGEWNQNVRDAAVAFLIGYLEDIIFGGRCHSRQDDVMISTIVREHFSTIWEPLVMSKESNMNEIGKEKLVGERTYRDNEAAVLIGEKSNKATKSESGFSSAMQYFIKGHIELAIDEIRLQCRTAKHELHQRHIVQNVSHESESLFVRGSAGAVKGPMRWMQERHQSLQLIKRLGNYHQDLISPLAFHGDPIEKQFISVIHLLLSKLPKHSFLKSSISKSDTNQVSAKLKNTDLLWPEAREMLSGFGHFESDVAIASKGKSAAMSSMITKTRRNPYLVQVLQREIQSYRKAVRYISTILQQADLYFGFIGADQIAHLCYDSVLSGPVGQILLENRVPTCWIESGLVHDTQLTFIDFIQDLDKRTDYIQQWIEEGDPVIHHLDMMRHPHLLLNAFVRDFAAHEKDASLDRVNWEVLILQNKPGIHPEKGFYVSGLKLLGAAWDSQRSQLRELRGRETGSEIPCIWVQVSILLEKRDSEMAQTLSAVKQKSIDQRSHQRYLCPIYVTLISAPHESYAAEHSERLRRGSLVGSLPLATDMPSRHWMRQGVCFVLEQPSL